MRRDSRIFVAGHQGLVGSAMVRRLHESGFFNLITVPHSELDLIDQPAVNDFFRTQKIDYVFLAAARVGGIHANNAYPADFLYENILIAANTLHAAAEANVKKLIYLGSNCIYPREAPQPMRETSLLKGPPEITNEAYAIAKIAGVKLCEYYFRQYSKKFISVMPTSLYGPGDNFDPLRCHVLPALLRKFHEAKINNDPKVVVWGSGHALREFLYVDDLADALCLLMDKYDSPELINVGSGEEVSIETTARLIKEITEYRGEVVFDVTKPDGSPRKLLNSEKISRLGWKPKTQLKAGLEKMYTWAKLNVFANQKSLNTYSKCDTNLQTDECPL